jgi:hypothetical protein
MFATNRIMFVTNIVFMGLAQLLPDNGQKP